MSNDSTKMKKSFHALDGSANNLNSMGTATNASQTTGNTSTGAPMASGMNMTNSTSSTIIGSATK